MPHIPAGITDSTTSVSAQQIAVLGWNGYCVIAGEAKIKFDGSMSKVYAEQSITSIENLFVANTLG